MEAILQRSEIADLLKAIHDGKVSTDQGDGEDDFLKCSPVNLFQLVRPDREQFRIPNFDIILDDFCRQYATSLTNQLQRNFTVTRASLETFEFQKFMADKNQPGAIGILELPPLKQSSLIFYDPKLSFSMLEMMLGASADIKSLELERQLTTIELNILKASIDDACYDIDKAFAPLLDIKTRTIKLENNPRLVSIVDPEGEVIVGTLHVKSGQYSGHIHLVFPFTTLEPLRDLLRELPNIAIKAKSSWHEIIIDKLQDMPLTLVAQAGTIDARIEDVLNLQIGDVLPLSYDPNSSVQVMVESSPKYYAVAGTHNGKKAISLTGTYR